MLNYFQILWATPCHRPFTISAKNNMHKTRSEMIISHSPDPEGNKMSNIAISDFTLF